MPYTDKLLSKLAEDMEIVNTGILSGEADCIRESTVPVKIPFCVENRPKGGYRHRLLDMHVDQPNVRWRR